MVVDSWSDVVVVNVALTSGTDVEVEVGNVLYELVVVVVNGTSRGGRSLTAPTSAKAGTDNTVVLIVVSNKGLRNFGTSLATKHKPRDEGCSPAKTKRIVTALRYPSMKTNDHHNK